LKAERPECCWLCEIPIKEVDVGIDWLTKGCDTPEFKEVFADLGKSTFGDGKRTLLGLFKGIPPDEG